ncbi:type VI secretion system protein TssA [Caulobacter sp. KR2-114]|uniref:type VI secretion system protein TssA n=1 Tax=Caulobacter sp. KR2-114 TaxID=3400912 RepID=UPI003BFFD01F
MASPATIDIEALLAPISDDAPAGVDLRQDSSPSSVYFQLKDARSAARRAERAADEEGEDRQVAEWQTILSLAPTVLAEQSKDLEITAWYIEALLRAHGFAGLRDGFALTAAMLERYWDSFHSLQDDDGLVTRLAPLSGLNGVESDGTLIQPLRKVVITVASGEHKAFSYYDYEQATAISQIADAAARQRRIDKGGVTLEVFSSSVAAGGGRYYIGLIEDLDGAITQFKALASLLDGKAGADSPPTSLIQDLLDSILQTVRTLSKDLVAAVAPAPAAAEEAAATGGEATSGAAAPAAAGGIPATGNALRNREDALRMMLQLAEYFRATEPQSPISNMLEEAVRRARMSFSDLLAELVPDQAQWRTALTNIGIRPPDAAG